MNALIHLAVGVFACAALGAAVDRVLVLLEPSAARWPIRVLLGVVAAYLALALPLFGLLTVACALALRRRATPVAVDSLSWRWIVGAVVVLGVVVSARPPVPLYWDEFVWLAKARLGAPDPRALVGEALRTGTDVVPIGYPLVHPIAVALLGGLASTPTSVMLGAEALTVLIAATFALTALEAAPTREGRRALAIAALVSCAPLVLVHLRSAYVDLETGMLAAAIFVLLERGHVRSATVLAIAVTGMKDEGIAHVLAVALARIATRREGRQRALAVLGIAAAAAAAWRIRVAASGLGGIDHALGWPRLARIPIVLGLVLRQATDVVSWGPVWIVSGALVIAVALRFVRLDASGRARLAALALQASFLFGAILAGTDRVAAFAESGTLVPRLLMQLVPLTCLVLASALATERAPLERR